MEDNGQESPTARPRTSPPAFVYDTHTDIDEEVGLPWEALLPPITAPGDETEVTHQRTEQDTSDRYSLSEDSPSGMLDGVDSKAHNDTPTLNRPLKPTMLDPEYSYNPYLDHDDDNEAHYRYDQSATLRTYLELPALPQAGRSEIRSASETANCVGFP